MRAFAFRLTPGTDLRAELERLTRDHALRAGCILSCVGSLSRAHLGPLFIISGGRAHSAQK